MKKVLFIIAMVAFGSTLKATEAVPQTLTQKQLELLEQRPTQLSMEDAYEMMTKGGSQTFGPKYLEVRDPKSGWKIPFTCSEAGVWTTISFSNGNWDITEEIESYTEGKVDWYHIWITSCTLAGVLVGFWLFKRRWW